MISFSTQRFPHFPGAVTALICGLLLAPILHGQNNDELFRGTWQIDTPDQGALILIVKNQGRASYFWGDNTDRTVYQGTWTSSEGTATLTWPDGGRHRIERDSLGFAVTYTDATGRERYTEPAQQVPAEILGQWAKPPTKGTEAVSDRDKAKGFFGIWKIGGDDDAAYVFVEADRSAASTETGGDGLRGSWAKQGSELHIAWDSGHYSILRENRREFAYKRIEPGKIIEDDESEMRPAVRTIEEKVPAGWMADYQREREIHTGGIAFSSRKIARAFYRGSWIVKLSDKHFERIEIGRFGGLRSTAERGQSGDWRMQGQDIFMRWDDGMREILSPIGRGFLLYEYKPGRPLDGVPTRIRAAAPADTGKLAEHLKGRDDVARQMLSLSEAAGIDPSLQEDAGWGRTFARWVWPFGEDEASPSTEAMLQEAYEAADEADPWWWPFWSEKGEPTAEPSVEKTKSTSVTEGGLDSTESPTLPTDESGEAESVALEVPEATDEAKTTSEVDSEEATEATPDSNEPVEEKTRRSVREWAWPF